MEDILLEIKTVIVTLIAAFTVIIALLYFLYIQYKNLTKDLNSVFYVLDNQSNTYAQHYWEQGGQFKSIQDKLLVLTTKHAQQIHNLEEQVKHAKQRANIAESKLKKINQERRSQ